MANHAAGAGTENLDHYKNCRRLYLGIDNIHGVRDTYLRLLESYPSLDVSSFDSYSILPYEFQGWYKHLSVLLDSTFKVVRLLDLGHSVLIHCSDGWDRTTQILTLAAILLDPYYRTIQGLIVLIEKEWISFGHRFADRSGLYSNVLVPKLDSIMYCEQFSYSKKNIREFSPIFPQFLEVLYQFLRIWPTSFQYNEQMLRFLLEHYYSGKYGNFLFNSEQEAVLLNEDFKESARVYQTNNSSISCPVLAADTFNRSNSTDCVPTNDDFVVIHSPPSLSSSAKVLLSVAASASLDPNIGNRRCDFTVHIYEAIIENFCAYCNLSYEVNSEERVLFIEQVPEPLLWKELYCGEIICDSHGNNQGKSVVENIKKEATLPNPKLDNTDNTVSGPSSSGKNFTTASPANPPQVSSQFRTASKPVIVKDHPMPKRQLPNATFSLLALSTSLENEFYLQKNA